MGSPYFGGGANLFPTRPLQEYSRLLEPSTIWVQATTVLSAEGCKILDKSAARHVPWRKDLLTNYCYGKRGPRHDPLNLSIHRNRNSESLEPRANAPGFLGSGHQCEAMWRTGLPPQIRSGPSRSLIIPAVVALPIRRTTLTGL